VLHEVEELTQRVVLIHRGRVVADGEVAEIRALLDEHPHRVRVRCTRPRALAGALLGEAALQVVGLELRGEDELVLETRAPGACFSALPGLLLREGGEVHELRAEDEDLDAVFRYLVRA
jgi:ABC-2 type transport system ATP-binding protein